MSTPLEGYIAAQINHRGPKTWDQINQESPFLTWLKDTNGIEVWEGGGYDIETNIITGTNSSFAAVGYKDQQTFAETDVMETVKLPAKFIDGHVTWYDADEDSNQGKFKVTSFVRTLLDAADEGAIGAMASEVWQGGSDNHLHGIPAIIDHGNTYQGKDRTATGNEYWKAKDTDAGHTSFNVTYGDGTTVTYGPYHTTEALVIRGGTDGGIEKLYNDCCRNGGTDGPDFGITSEPLFRKLCALAAAEKMEMRNPRMAELGFPENLQFRGATIVWDRKCGAAAGTPDATTFYLLNSKYLKLRPCAGYNGTFKATETFSLHPLGIHAKAKMMRWSGNLSSNRPQSMGRLTNKS